MNLNPSSRRRIAEAAAAHGVPLDGWVATARVLDARGIRWDAGHAGELTGNPQPVPESPIEDLGGEQPRTTLRRMADVLRGRHPEPGDVASAFDSATLPPEGADATAPPLWPRNPVPPGGRERGRASREPRGRPAGADDLQGLFATGLMVLLAFSLGEELAPTEAEANAIAVPLSNILARRIDLAAKLGRDASDTIALAVALMAYSYRVVPIAAERVRHRYAANRQSERIIEPASRFADYRGADGMAAGQGDGASPASRAAAHPLDALAQARTTGLNVLARDLGAVPNNGYPVGPDGEGG
jgi:hypothetical protein